MERGRPRPQNLPNTESVDIFAADDDAHAPLHSFHRSHEQNPLKLPRTRGVFKNRREQRFGVTRQIRRAGL